MTTETVAEFCGRHGACADGRKWALANCASMAEVYDKCERGDWLLWAIRRSGIEVDKATLIRLAIVFARRALQRFERKNPTDKRPRKAIEAAEAERRLNDADTLLGRTTCERDAEKARADKAEKFVVRDEDGKVVTQGAYNALVGNAHAYFDEVQVARARITGTEARAKQAEREVERLRAELAAEHDEGAVDSETIRSLKADNERLRGIIGRARGALGFYGDTDDAVAAILREADAPPDDAPKPPVRPKPRRMKGNLSCSQMSRHVTEHDENIGCVFQTKACEPVKTTARVWSALRALVVPVIKAPGSPVWHLSWPWGMVQWWRRGDSKWRIGIGRVVGLHVNAGRLEAWTKRRPYARKKEER